MRLRAAAGAALLASMGCYDPTFVSGVTRCSPSGKCPANWVCRSEVCVDPSAPAGAGGATGAAGTTGVAGSTGAGRGGTSGTAGRGGSTGAAGHGGTTGTAGRGGTTGTAGRGGATGAAGTTGAAGRGGSGGGTAICPAMPPASALVTDFGSSIAASNSGYLFGSNSGFTIGTFAYGDATTNEVTPTLTPTGGKLMVTASSKGSFVGLGLYFGGNKCLDASAYRAIAFTLSMPSGTCAVSFGVTMAPDSLIGDDSRAQCAANPCYPPMVPLTLSGSQTIPFSSLTGSGAPLMTLDPRQILGVEWQLQPPAGATTCTSTFALDDLTFTN